MGAPYLFKKDIMHKMIQIFALFLFTLLFTACDQKVLYPKKTKSSVKATTKKLSVKSNSKKSSKVTVGDTIDYATGETPLRTKQFIKNQLGKSYKTRYKK